MGLHPELPAAGPWAGPGAVCGGGPRSHCQERLCGAVHHTLHKPTDRLSTCPFIESRWFQPVPRHTLHPRQSDPQRSPHQNRVRAYRRRQTQSMTCIRTRPKAAFSDNKGLWRRSSECEGRERETAAASRSPNPDLKWSNLQWATSQHRKKDVVYQRWRSTLALSKWIASGWIMNPWSTVGVFALVSAECSGNRALRIVVPGTRWWWICYKMNHNVVNM